MERWIEDVKMTSLFDLMQEEVEKLNIDNFKELDDFITKEDKCNQYIICLLGDFPVNLLAEVNNNVGDKLIDGRIQHIILTLLFGRILFKIDRLNKATIDLAEKIGITRDQLWLLISLNHDRGYFNSNVKKSDLEYEKKFLSYLTKEPGAIRDTLQRRESGYNHIDFDEFDVEYRHFDDIRNDVLAYDYGEIIEYDRYMRIRHLEWGAKYGDPEKVDHGILGGFLTYNLLIRKILLLNEDFTLTDETKKLILAAKVVSLTIAQHNMFKIDIAEYNNISMEYRMHEIDFRKMPNLIDADFLIKTQTPLLYVLSLVDTIECVKRFGRKLNPKEYLTAPTVLKNIHIFVDSEHLVLDFYPLKDYIESKKKDKNLVDVLKKHMKTIGAKSENNPNGFDSWLDIKVQDKDDYIKKYDFS